MAPSRRPCLTKGQAPDDAAVGLSETHREPTATAHQLFSQRCVADDPEAGTTGVGVWNGSSLPVSQPLID
jgi:hypothetical protein